MNVLFDSKNSESPHIITLKEALHKRQIIERNIGNSSQIDIFAKSVEKDSELASTPIKRYIGKGSSAIVFETKNGDILKLTNGNHFLLNRPHEDFDVPIIKSGKVGSIRYYFEEKLLQHGLSDGFVEIMRDMIIEKGYKPYDLGEGDIQQIGLSREGKLFLADSECARFKTIFHALWYHTKKFFKIL